MLEPTDQVRQRMDKDYLNSLLPLFLILLVNHIPVIFLFLVVIPFLSSSPPHSFPNQIGPKIPKSRTIQSSSILSFHMYIIDPSVFGMSGIFLN